MKIFLLILGGLAVIASARRIRVRPVGAVSDEASQQVEYYAEQEEEEGPVLVSRQDTYGRATGQSRLQPKLKPNHNRPPPVQTIRNYNKLNDDGSFTFGYEAADGSFKEETRGTDCVVRGKYGYIDPDGNKREFTYVSGNPCDPNEVQQEEEEQLPDSGEENIPQNIPRRPIKPLTHKIVTTPRPLRPATTVFQQDYNRDSEEEDEVPITQRPIVAYHPAPPVSRPLARPTFRQFPIPTFAELEEQVRPQILAKPRPTPRTKPIVLTATPARSQSVTATPQPPATTYRPQLVVTPAAPSPGSGFEQELKNFQLENNVVSTPKPALKKPAPVSNHPIYTSELVFDPNTGQYNTVVYQQLPQTTGDFSLRGRLQPYVAPYYQPRHAYAAAAPVVRPQPLGPQQQLFQQQQAALVQQSQQLFAAQQQRKLAQKPLPQSVLQQEPQRFVSAAHQPKPFAPSQPFYYVTPDRGIASGQIDAFLRGHSIAI